MSRNNTFYTKNATLNAVVSDPTILWDFLEEAFDEFDVVSFERDTENKVMYIYLDETKKLYITVGVDSGAIKIRHYLGENQCSYYYSYSQTQLFFSYLRTKWGIMWGYTTTAASVSYDVLQNFFVFAPVPVLVCGVTVASNNTYYLASPLHEEFEDMNESAVLISTTLGTQRFAVTNAYSCFEDINSQHLFRVLGVPGNSYPKGSVKVGDKYLFWTGRYALEYDPDDTTGV